MDESNGAPSCVPLLARRLGRTRDMIHPDTRALLTYWQTLRGGRDVPLRSEVEPRDMGCDVRNLFILEDLGAGNLRFRLGGSALTEAFGTELRGLSARTLMEGRARESFVALIAETLAEPGVGYARLADPRDPQEVWEVLLLPLRSDFGGIDRVLGGLVQLRPGRMHGRRGKLATERLRFRIEEMTIRPVGGGAAALAPRGSERGQPAEGFAETQEPFRGPEAPGEKGPCRAQLRAIEGGLGETGEARPARRRTDRPALRIVRDE